MRMPLIDRRKSIPSSLRGTINLVSRIEKGLGNSAGVNEKG